MEKAKFRVFERIVSVFVFSRINAQEEIGC